ncbi:MAG: hypothetical protein ACQEQV_08365, partial [Fibrobacterota bacterium]
RLGNPYRPAGQGNIRIESFSDSGYPMLKKARHELRRIGIKTFDFTAVHGDFVLRHGGVETDTVTCDNSLFDIYLQGDYRFPGKNFVFDIEGVIDPAYKKFVTSVVWEALLDGENGSKRFQGTVRGTADSYRVSVNIKIIKRGVRSFFRNIFSN